MKPAGYIRVSDDKLKKDGERRQDIERQKQKIISYCKTMQLEHPIFFEDDALSGFKDDYSSRPAFVRMLREVKANRVKHIIVEDLSRWSRRIVDGLTTLSQVNEKATITSLAEGDIGVDIPEKWFKTAIGLLMAEWASRITAFKVRDGMRKRLSKPEAKCKVCGDVHLGRVPKKCKEVMEE